MKVYELTILQYHLQIQRFQLIRDSTEIILIQIHNSYTMSNKEHIELDEFNRVKDLRYRLYRKKSDTYEWDDDLIDQIESMEGFGGWDKFGDGGTWDILWLGAHGMNRTLVKPVQIVPVDLINRNLIQQFPHKFRGIETLEEYQNVVNDIRNTEEIKKEDPRSKELSIDEALEYIDSHELMEIQSFISDDEDRAEILIAWKKKGLAEAEQTE